MDSSAKSQVTSATPFTISVVKGDLIEAKVDAIVQQCNCLTVRSHGLSAYIATKLDIDHYSLRKPIGKKNLAIKEDRDVPGTVKMHQITMVIGKPYYVACLFGQFTPGLPGKYYNYICKEHGITETKEAREQWFKESLEKLTDELIGLEITSVAFPYGIGCGLAGGSWPKYAKMITEWGFKNQNNFSIVFVKK